MATIIKSRKLNMGFQTDAESDVNLNVHNPLASLTAEAVSQAMGSMIGKNALQDAKGNPVTRAVSAKIVEVTETPLF